MGGGGEPSRLRGVTDDAGKLRSSYASSWRNDLRRVGAVEAEDGVKVANPTCLEFGHLGVGQPDPDAVLAGQAAKAAADRDCGAAPKLGSVGVPYHGPVVVVAVRAKRPAKAGVGFLVALAAGQAPPVRAVTGLAAGAATGDLAALAQGSGVHGPEGGRGEGGEYTRVDGDRFGDALASGEARADELVGVAPVGFGAGRQTEARRSPHAV